MKPVIYAIILSAGLIYSSHAQAIGGTVTDSAGAGIEGAVVRLTGTGDETVTGSDGSWSIIPTGMARYVAADPGQAAFNRGTLRFRVTGVSEHVRADLFSMNGRHLSTLLDRELDAGSYTLEPGARDLAPDMYILRLQTGKNEFSFKMPVLGRGTASAAALERTRAGSGSPLSKTAETIDTLIVRAAGYVSAMDTVNAYEGTFDFSLKGLWNGGMVLIEGAGQTFSMGNDSADYDETPAHDVTFTKNWNMSSAEVTNAEFAAILNYATEQGYLEHSVSGPYYDGGNRQKLINLKDRDRQINLDETDSIYVINPGAENLPVVGLTWHGCAFYANMLSEQEGLDVFYNPANWSYNTDAAGYRLPTEAEWEFSARAGSTTEYYWGDEPDAAYANGGDNWPDDGYDETAAPVGRFIPNAYGLYDMAGNAYEWVNDWYDNYTADPVNDPWGPPGEFGRKTLRGGGFRYGASYLRSSDRDVTGSALLFMGGLGFRIVKPAE